MADSFIGGGNRRKPPTYLKSLTTLSHNVVSSAPRLIVIQLPYEDDHDDPFASFDNLK
jgi:hypothetical protein